MSIGMAGRPKKSDTCGIAATPEPEDCDLKYDRPRAPILPTILICLAGVSVGPAANAQTDTTAESYIAQHGVTLAPAGQLEIDGRRMACGQHQTVLDPDYHDFGGAFRSFLILNPDRFSGLPTPVKLWIYAHECAHQTVGADEVKADCIAVQRGRREGWLTQSGLEQVCEFMRPARGDQSHFTGTQRCALMRQCFKR